MRVSVVIPCYNSARFLNESVASIASQTIPAIEIIIVDDASTDDSYEYACSLQDKFTDIRINVLRNKKNLGPGPSRNRGIAESFGNYVAFLDADDVWLPDKLEQQLKFMRQHNVAAVISEVVITDEKLVPFDKQNKSDYQGIGAQALARAIYLGKITMSTPTLVAERMVLIEHGGFDETLRLREDHALLIKLALDDRLAVYAAPVVNRRAHAESYSSAISPLGKYRHEMQFHRKFKGIFDLETVANAHQGIYRTMIAHCFLVGNKQWAMRFVRKLRSAYGLSTKQLLAYYTLAILPSTTARTLLGLKRRLKKSRGVANNAPEK